MTGVTGEALFKYIRKVACAHARPVVTDGEDGLGRAARERKREYRRIACVLYAVAHDLPEQEAQPAPVGEHGLVRKPDLDLEALFLQQRAVIVEHLVDAAAQRQALEPIVAPRAAQARIVEHLVDERLHPVACVVELEADRLRQRVAPIVEHERQQRQRRFHFVRPELHVVLVVVHLRLQLCDGLLLRAQRLAEQVNALRFGGGEQAAQRLFVCRVRCGQKGREGLLPPFCPRTERGAHTGEQKHRRQHDHAGGGGEGPRVRQPQQQRRERVHAQQQPQPRQILPQIASVTLHAPPPAGSRRRARTRAAGACRGTPSSFSAA